MWTTAKKNCTNYWNIEKAPVLSAQSKILFTTCQTWESQSPSAQIMDVKLFSSLQESRDPPDVDFWRVRKLDSCLVFLPFAGKHEKHLSAWCTLQPWKMLRHLVARMSLTLINGWRWRTHVAALMRQFIQFCKKTMAVHFIAMWLLGHISAAASFHSEEFRPAINQNPLPSQRWAPVLLVL